ncbi:PepSY domain-containing protein [Brevibacillus sp. NPDC058079]|uniref:PepSY domain-containing protein n=1 Tax=unclassified Brevibacillus TaxID=2684853 RepID=UPI0002710BA4|nr:PepSY domain-containing protein [Brevibacillus sp. BC25]EJL25359.1 Peptidase propeptide domain-containing protein [Brevibacillus sp. BC25]
MRKTAIGKWAGIWLAVLGGGMSVHATGHSLDQAKEISAIIEPTDITKEDAIRIALQQVKGRVVHVELEKDEGVLAYEIIILTEQNQVFEIDVDVKTGKVIKVESENL